MVLTTTRRRVVLMLMLVALPASFTAQKKETGSEKERVATQPGLIWRDPGDPTSLNLFYGAGGKGHAPDLAQTNNSVYEVDGERRYVISDLGATFENTGNNLTRSKSAPRAYAGSTFIEKTRSDFIDFVLHSRPFFLSAVNVPNYRNRTRMEQVTKHIPRADAKWLGQRLAMLSEEQICDAFRAAGYTQEEVWIYTQAMRKRIGELGAL